MAFHKRKTKSTGSEPPASGKTPRRKATKGRKFIIFLAIIVVGGCAVLLFSHGGKAPPVHAESAKAALAAARVRLAREGHVVPPLPAPPLSTTPPGRATPAGRHGHPLSAPPEPPSHTQAPAGGGRAPPPHQAHVPTTHAASAGPVVAPLPRGAKATHPEPVSTNTRAAVSLAPVAPAASSSAPSALATGASVVSTATPGVLSTRKVTTTATSAPAASALSLADAGNSAAFFAAMSRLMEADRLQSAKLKLLQTRTKIHKLSLKLQRDPAATDATLPAHSAASSSSKVVASTTIALGLPSSHGRAATRLVSVLGVGGNYLAVLRVRGASFNVHVGSTLPSGWHVATITPSHVVLVRGSKRRVLHAGQ